MKWEKRDCPVKIELYPYGAGWEDVIVEFGEESHSYAISGSLGDGFGALVQSLYALYPGHDREGDRCRWLEKCADLTGDWEGGKWVNVRPKGPDDSSYFTVPVQTRFLWDEEGCGVNWILTRPATEDTEFPLTVELEEFSDYGPRSKITGKYKHAVSYADMCYAVGKALTAAVKSHGFTGFEESVWESDVNVRHLCFLKACGMGRPDFVRPVFGKNQGDGDVSSFADEMELLAFDM